MLPAHLQKANPWRLIPAGLSLVVLSLFLGSLMIAFFHYFPRVSSGTERLKKFVTYQLALARLEQARTGQVRFRRTDKLDLGEMGCGDSLHPGTRVEHDPGETHFTVLMFPKERFPFFPYNYLTSQPTYRSDETGKIRMVHVHHQDVVCPPDAPVVMLVTELDIQEMLKRLDEHGNCQSAPRPDTPSSLSSSGEKEIANDGTLIADASGVVFDKKTGLEWFAGPDRGTTWNDAKAWVESLNVAGGGWRMPTREELKTLYQKGAGTRNMTSLLKTTGWWVWSGETRDSSSTWTFSFYLGYEFWFYRSSSDYFRGFAVRSRRQ